jgi:glutamate synthase domain-containing protein 1
MFLPPNLAEREVIKNEFAKIIAEEGQTLLGWRDVPVDNSSLGKTAVVGRAVHGAGFRRAKFFAKR